MKINPYQWRNENILTESFRDGAIDIRVTIGQTYMGATIGMAEADDLAKFIIEAGIAHRAALTTKEN